MYNDVLPMSHRESLKKYPLDNALAYNNCMFLAHECLQIFVPIDKLPESLKQRPLTFADLVPKLRQTGVEIFMEQMKSIKDEFQVLLRDPFSGLFSEILLGCSITQIEFSSTRIGITRKMELKTS